MSKIQYQVEVVQVTHKACNNSEGEEVKYDFTESIIGRFTNFEDVDGFVHTIMNCFDNASVSITIVKEEQ